MVEKQERRVQMTLGAIGSQPVRCAILHAIYPALARRAVPQRMPSAWLTSPLLLLLLLPLPARYESGPLPGA